MAVYWLNLPLNYLIVASGLCMERGGESKRRLGMVLNKLFVYCHQIVDMCFWAQQCWWEGVNKFFGTPERGEGVCVEG